MPRGNHRYNFQFKLPESTLPCSFESKVGTIRYYLRATMDMPVSSSPQSKKYFSIIGPHIDCMDERYLVSDPCLLTFISLSQRKHRHVTYTSTKNQN